MIKLEPGTIRGVIDRFEEDLAIIITEDKKSISWPKASLPEGVNPGSSVYLSIAADETKANQQLAKALLNEILNAEDSTDKA